MYSTPSSSLTSVFDTVTTARMLFTSAYRQIDNDTSRIILAAFCGGLFAGLFSDFFESRRRIREKRSDKYYDHRNTLVQIEHEIIPIRANMSRNLVSIEDALNNIDDNTIRIVLRLYTLDLSTGLSLKLINKTLINLYSETYISIQQINSDIQFINDLVSTIVSDSKVSKVDVSKIRMYVEMLRYLKIECDKSDKQILELVSTCQAIFDVDDKAIVNRYMRHGGEIEYRLSKDKILAKSNKLEAEENREAQSGDERPNFLAAYLDIKRVV